ncbi:MAG: cysteine desulfurase [Cyanobacteria bacterium J083]|nr:MAG: cysteine desulfurase [Cyanobacteria bacterium J083]
MQIYLDYSATTPPHPQVIAKMSAVMSQAWGNPSSIHSWGKRAATILETARMQVANLIQAELPQSIIFTSGGTEANNLAIRGVAQKYSIPQHIIISSVEHSAIAQPINFLAKKGWQITRLPVDPFGRVKPEDLAAALQDNTVLVSIIYGQSEVGTIQPIKELAAIARKRGILFHTDAVQAAGRLPINVDSLGIDLLSLSSHKIYGAQGAGALYIRPSVKLSPLIRGGGQELNLRSGTQALPTIAGFGVAAEIAAQQIITENHRLWQLRDRLFSLLAKCPYLEPTGDRISRLPHHLSFVIKQPAGYPPLVDEKGAKITGKTLVRQLDLAGIGISAGSACQSGKLSPSPVLIAMGYSAAIAQTAIRLTLGKDTTEADIDWTAMVIGQIIKRLQAQLIVT